MSRVTLIECSPRLPDGTVQTLRLVDRSPRAAAYFGAQWLPHVVELPAFESSIGFDGQRFGAAPSPQIGALGFALAPEIRSAAGWVWRDAPVSIRHADWPLGGGNPADAAFGPAQLCNAAGIAVNDGVARVELIDRGQLLRVPVATQRFGSSGNALIDAAAAARDRQAGQAVPVAFGRVFTLPGLLVDRANNIWLFAGSAAASVQAFYDGGVPFTIGVARANLAALQAASPAAGNVVDYCLSAGGLFLARPGDRPTYPFTADATFGSAGLGDVAFNLLGGRLSFTTLPVPLNSLGLGDVGLYIDDETTVAEALDRLFGGLGIAWKVRADGTIDARRVGWATPAASFASHQRHTPQRLRIVMPTAKRALGYAANNRVHGEGEIARILLATDLAYADGTLVEALKPAQAGADVTADQPVVSRLDEATGLAADNFRASATGSPFAQLVASGAARDGDVVNFPATLPAPPKIFFLPGGNAPTAGQNVRIRAEGLSASGFTMVAKSQVVTTGATITDLPSSAGGFGEPARVIDRSNSGGGFDGGFSFRVSVTVNDVFPGEPGSITLAFFVRSGGTWREAARQAFSATGNYDVEVSPGPVDFGTGAEFGVTAVALEGAGTALSDFVHVRYTLGTVTEVSLTPSGASAIPWQAFL